MGYRKEDCCYATQWDSGRKIVATQPNGIKNAIYKDQTLVATQPNGTPCVKYIEKIVATQPTREKEFIFK